MFRLRGLSESIRELAGPVVTDGFAAITRLGDPLFLLVVIAVYYWLATERDGPAQLIAFTLLAVAVTVALKNGLALPRPAAAVQAVPADDGSYGFPSGHAIGSTVVYGGLVAVDDRFQRPAVASGIAVLVALVALSRVVIGVHYVGDVLVGVAIGLGLLVALRASDSQHRPVVAAAASVVAIPAVVVTGGGTDSTLALGASLGGALIFSRVDIESLPDAAAVAERVGLVALGLAVVGGVYALALAVGHPLATVAAGIVMFGALLGLPRALALWPAPAAD